MSKTHRVTLSCCPTTLSNVRLLGGRSFVSDDVDDVEDDGYDDDASTEELQFLVGFVSRRRPIILSPLCLLRVCCLNHVFFTLKHLFVSNYSNHFFA